jgi:TRAP-type C4-dicarboxylate transport system permease small subunit
MWLIYVGMVLALNRGTHASVDILSAHCSGKAKIMVQLAVHTIAVALFAVLLFQGLLLFNMVQGQASPAMRISMMIPYASLPFGSLLMIIEELFLIAGVLRTPMEDKQ